MTIASADDVRAAIAAHVLGDAVQRDDLGEVTLHPHQREGLERIRRLIAQHGGALLADEVGLGKTFVALAAAREARDPLVVAPAALRDVWTSAALRAAVPVRFVSTETLSRTGAPDVDPDLVVIDEAHHLRSRRTRRFAAACALCRGANVLLMTATPIQNRLADLRTMLSLFLGERVLGMSEEDLAPLIVRRLERDPVISRSVALPSVRAPQWMRPREDVDCLDRLLALPAPLPPADGENAGVLLTYTLVRQWSSSRAALRSALQRRLARAHAMEDALLAGRMPSRAELTAWCYAEGAQQLTFPELAVQGEVADGGALLSQVQQHRDTVRELLAWLGATEDPDASRAEALRDVMRHHPGERVVAFSEYADTVSALYRALAPNTRVAMLTHSGGRVAGGPLSRRELLMRFSPGACLRVHASDRVDMLLTTDVLSEGVNLQDASVVIHLDLSWNPARLEQRVGRLRRIGAARDAISVYVMAPPAPAERMLRLDQRLRLKLGVAGRTLGVAGTILPGFAAVEEGSARREERIAAAIRSWRRFGSHVGNDLPLCAAARSSRNAALACIRCRGVVSLVALVEDHVVASAEAVEELLGCAGGPDAEVAEAEARPVQERLEAWLRRHAVSQVVDLPALRVARSRRALLHRVDTIARRASRHAQPRLAPLMRAARSAAIATLSAGAERVLDQLVCAPMTDEAWLHAVGEFAALNARSQDDAPAELLAVLILRES